MAYVTTPQVVFHQNLKKNSAATRITDGLIDLVVLFGLIDLVVLFC
jgi:hypothetical protein